MNLEETISGYAAIYYRPGDKATEYALGPDMIERIKPGAFRNVLNSGDTTSQTNHDPNLMIGRQGTDPLSLSLREDATGLHTRVFPFDTAAGRDALTLVRSRGLRGMSFGFSLAGGKDAWHRENGIDVRTIEEVGYLFDASPVVNPAYTGTSCKIELAQRSVATSLFRYDQRAHELRRSIPTSKGQTKMMLLERSDDRTRGQAPQRAELQRQTRLRLYQRRADLLAELVRLDKLSADDRTWQEDRITRELAEVDREEKQLDAVMESRAVR